MSHGEQNRQLNLFDHTDYEKLEKLDKAIDDIRKRFGGDAVCRASFVEKNSTPKR